MKKPGASQGQSASELISKRIAELGDWRGEESQVLRDCAPEQGFVPFSAGHCDLTYWQARGTARRELPGATRLSFFQGYVLGTAALPLTDAPLTSLADGIAKGRVPSLLTKTFDFDQVPRAHAFMESERTLGKIVVRV